MSERQGSRWIDFQERFTTVNNKLLVGLVLGSLLTGGSVAIGGIEIRESWDDQTVNTVELDRIEVALREVAVEAADLNRQVDHLSRRITTVGTEQDTLRDYVTFNLDSLGAKLEEVRLDVKEMSGSVQKNLARIEMLLRDESGEEP